MRFFCGHGTGLGARLLKRLASPTEAGGRDNKGDAMTRAPAFSGRNRLCFLSGSATAQTVAHFPRRSGWKPRPASASAMACCAR